MWDTIGLLVLQQLARPDMALTYARRVEQIGNLIAEKRRADPTRNVFRDMFEITSTLGAGSFGVVFKVKKKEPVESAFSSTIKKYFGALQKRTDEPEVFAVKMVPRSPDENLEIKSLSDLIHKNIITYYYAWDEKHGAISSEDQEYFRSHFPEDYLYYSCGTSDSLGTKWDKKFGPEMDVTFILQEFCDQGTLADKLVEWEADNSQRNLTDVDSIFHQIVQGLAYLDQKGVTHRDLKPDNIFILKENGEYLAKVGDFGLAVHNTINFDSESNPGPSNATCRLTQMQQKLRLADRKRYQSPEQCLEKLYTHKGDIYALGLIYMAMLHPFSDEVHRRRAISKLMESNETMKFPPGFETTFPPESELIRRMVSFEMEPRPTAQEILEWFNETKLPNSSEPTPGPFTSTPPGQEISLKELRNMVHLVQGLNNPSLLSLLEAVMPMRIPPAMILRGHLALDKYLRGESEYKTIMNKLLDLFDRLDARGKLYLFEELSRIPNQNGGILGEEDKIDFETLNKMLAVAVVTVDERHIGSVRVTEATQDSGDPPRSRGPNRLFPFF